MRKTDKQVGYVLIADDLGKGIGSDDDGVCVTHDARDGKVDGVVGILYPHLNINVSDGITNDLTTLIQNFSYAGGGWYLEGMQCDELRRHHHLEYRT
jgi:hypothetical protein